MSNTTISNQTEMIKFLGLEKYVLLDGTNGKKLDSKQMEYYNGFAKVLCTVYRIMVNKPFTDPNGIRYDVGDVGGYVQSENNLSQNGSCWIDKSSCVVSNSKILDDSIVKNHSILYDNMLNGSDICNNNIITRSESSYEKLLKHDEITKAQREKAILDSKFPLDLRAQQKLKNDELKKKTTEESKKTTATYLTKEEKLDNTMKSFSNMNEIYIVKELRI